MKTIGLELTQQDINNGKRGNPKLCALALAAERSFLPRAVVFVTPLVLVMRSDDGLEDWYTLPREAQQFQRDFDAAWDDIDRALADSMQPTTFTLTLVEWEMVDGRRKPSARTPIVDYLREEEPMNKIPVITVRVP